MSSDHLEGMEGKSGKEKFSLEMEQLTISLQSNPLTLIYSHTHPISPGCPSNHYRYLSCKCNCQ